MMAGARLRRSVLRSSCWVGVIAAAPHAACGGVLSSLEPAGPAAARIEALWWVLFGVGALVFVAVVGLLARAMVGSAKKLGGGRDRTFVVVAGVAVPAVILVGLLVETVRTGAVLTELPVDAAVTVEVIGHQFWWEVRYPEQGIVTANELHIPVGRPVRVRVTSADVIHSFWVPRLHGKLDMVPGRVSEYWIQADEAGVYPGHCAEFCGMQHAKMAFLVVAEPPAAFQDWLEERSTPARIPEDPVLQAGLEVFLEAGCDQCHVIRGVTPPEPDGLVGPDLTHLASRRTLAAGILENTRGNLAGWILSPQAIKPGNRMPPTWLEPENLHRLVRYLESLR